MSNGSWRVDETYIRVKGRWTYLYRAVDSRGHVDKNPAYPRAVADMKSDGQLWRRTRLRQCKYLNNIVEQDHRRIKRLVRPGLGFGSFPVRRGKRWRVFETMAMMRKGQLRKIDGHDIRGQAAFIADLFDRAA